MKEKKEFDVFNGDADGICSLQQFRLSSPKHTELITGVKRNIKLLESITHVQDCIINVFDISMEVNRPYLQQLLEQNNQIFYFDHHIAPSIPDSPQLRAFINTSPSMCTSLLVNQYLEQRHYLWAITGAFGDNLNESATILGHQHLVNEPQLKKLQELGKLLNYNGYGSKVEDLHFPPAILYQEVKGYVNPLDFWEASPMLQELKVGFQEDFAKAKEYSPYHQSSVGEVYLFPDERWSQRIAGTFTNHLARDNPNYAHALLIQNRDGTYMVSVRSPLENRYGADTLCRQFSSGGGRVAAAGINALPENEIDLFIQQFIATYSALK